jgi:glycosyltransferase involved in cell wall biosynthesis
MTLYILTLEQIEKRYTKQWHSYWISEFKKYFQNVVNIDGTITSDKIEKGRFLDINKTNIWKSEQVIKVAKLFKENKIKDYDTFLFMDFWHPGAINIKYMAQLNHINVLMYGYAHAGSYDRFDFLNLAGLTKYVRGFEESLFAIFDGIFVATNFHKQLILNTYKNTRKKIHVVGFPMRWDKEIKDKIGDKVFIKEDIVVFPHRLDKEKQPEEFDKLAKICKNTNIKFIKTMEVTKNKTDYYELLAKAKIIFSANLQETYGIGTVEAMALGCYPLVPDRLSYTEMYNDLFKYKDIVHASLKLIDFIHNFNKPRYEKIRDENIKKIKKESLNSIKLMAQLM